MWCKKKGKKNAKIAVIKLTFGKKYRTLRTE